MKKSKIIKRVSALLIVFAILLSMFSGIAMANSPPVASMSISWAGMADGRVLHNVFCTSSDVNGDPLMRSWVISPTTGFSGGLSGMGGGLLFTQLGLYEITLRVFDGTHWSSANVRTINITNLPPVAAITVPATAVTGAPVVVACASTDNGGPLATRTWTITPSTGFTGSLTGTGGALTFTAAGTYTISLHVTDGEGMFRVVSRTVTVTNPAPVAAITAPATAPIGIVTIACASTDSNGTIATRAWTITPSTGFMNVLTGTVSTLWFTEMGTYTIGLTVTDNHGATNTTSKVITITNFIPEASIDAPTNTVTNREDIIRCASFDSLGTITTREWKITPNTGFIGSLTEAENSIVFTTAGSYFVELTVTDNHGAVSSTSKVINVKNAVVVDIIAPATALIGSPVDIVYESVFSEDVNTYNAIDDSWTWWTVTPSTGFTGSLTGTGGTLTFTAAGTYVIELLIVDSIGDMRVFIEEIIINTAPVAAITAPATALTGAPVVVACASTDSNGTIATRAWTITPSTGFTGTLTGTGGTLTFTAAGTYTIGLIATDNQGATNTASRIVTITNTAPVAAITVPATALTGTPVVVTCASTDSDGTIASRAWTITPSTGFTGTLTGTGGTLTFTAAGTYAIELTATDNLGATNVTSRTIVVNASPVAAITAPATALTGAPVVIACASTDSNGTIATREWTITPSTGFTGSLTGTGGILTFTAAGTYTIGLTTTDNQGATNTASRIVTITNTAPVAAITVPATALTGTPVVVTCASTDSDGAIASRAWTITPSTGFTGTLTGTGGTLTFTAAGTYAIELTATDNLGATNVTSRTIVVNASPVAAITAPATALTGAPVVIACASTDSNGTIATREWTITPSTGFTGSLTGTGGILTFTAAGTYTIGLTTTDNQGATNITSRVVIVTNTAPVAAITVPATALTGAPVVIACASTDSNGTIATRAWTITPSTGFTGTLTGTGGTLTFTAAGTYAIELTATDNLGATNVTSRTIVVNASPVAAITAPATALTGAPVVIACASTDSDGEIISREWTVTPSTGFTGSLTGTGGSLTFTAAGTYTVSLTVIDNKGATSVISREITVTLVNVSPVAAITVPATALTGAPVVIACASTDSNGTIASRAWTVTPSTGFTGTLTGTGGTLTFTAAGTYALELTVTDNEGAESIVSRTIAINASPVAAITAPATALSGAPVVIACASTDSNGAIAIRAWTITPSTGFTGSLAGTGGTLTFTAAGTYTIGLTVTDNEGATRLINRSISITTGTTAPNVTVLNGIIMPTSALVDTVVAIACSSIISDRIIVSRTWTVTPSAGFTGTLTGEGGTLVFNVVGTFNIRLTVIDSTGRPHSGSRNIIITNIVPVARITIPTSAGLGTQVAIACSSTDANGHIANRTWTITPSTGFTGTLTGAGGTLTFTTPGTYTVRLVAIDNHGGTNTVSRAIRIINAAPVAGMTIPASAVTNTPVDIACASTDVDGTIVNRVWTITPSTGFTGTLTGTGGTLTFTAAGTYTVTITVTDSGGRIAAVSRMINVSQP